MSNATSLQGFGSDAEEIERNAYNAAFHALGLRWYWDTDTYNELQSISDARERVRIYLRTRQTHLLAAYDADFLINAIETKKADCRQTEDCSGPVASRYFNWAEARAGEVGA
ncbi:hypothetical protein [Methylibium sp.]|uniref:hypothetical protein n=1 Tax=Methylibium sp. TaxID=2067992 RepID=UPI0017F7D3D4|nr:hypothetical protein [Methylibium sp.]MBA3588943.1 hypothetical protein [Methylibium sp.]